MDIVMFIAAGIAGGLIGGMGMGGGTLLIPILTLGLAVPQLQAQSINLISFIPMAIVSLVINCKNKLVKLKSVIVMTPLAIGGCVLGAIASSKINGELLRRIFGSFLLIIGVVYMLKTTMDIFMASKRSH